MNPSRSSPRNSSRTVIIPLMECPHCHTELPNTAAFCHRCGGGADGNLEPSDYRYAAFISYRHLPLDAEVAKQVQRAIETFRMPRGTVGTTLSNWPQPGRPLGNCFRDEDELSATHSLPESIRQALAQSRTLVVVCSPQTKESPWVRQEIEMFAQMHGRNRIICVLASGSSDESIPPALKTRLMPDSQGVIREMPSQPLAADLREPSKSQRKPELLRIIAAVAGCSFDDLRQRQRTRKNRRIAIAAAVTAVLVALIAALLFAAASSAQSALIAESKSLAAASRDQFAHGDRMAAIETALSALPSSEADRSRPLVPEAQEALEEALLVYDDPNNAYRPLFDIVCPDEVSSFVVSDTGSWIAVLDKSGIIHGYSGLNGKERYTIDLREHTSKPEDIDTTQWIMAAHPDDVLLVGCNSGYANLAGFDGNTGDLIWELEGTRTSGLDVPYLEDIPLAALFSVNRADGNIIGVLLDVETGEFLWVDRTDSFDFGSLPILASLPCDFSLDKGLAAVGFGSEVICFDIFGDFYSRHSFGTDDSMLVTSLLLTDDAIVASLYDPFSDDHDENSPYVIAASSLSSDQDAPPLWSEEGTYGPSIVGTLHDPILLKGMPTIQCLVYDKEPAVVCTAGRKLSVRSCIDGRELFREETQASAVEAGSLYLESITDDGEVEIFRGSDIYFTVTGNGIIDGRCVSVPYHAFADNVRCAMPNPVDRAQFLVPTNNFDIIGMVVAHAADEKNRILVFGSFSSDSYATPGTTPLDELIAQAHELLAAE